MTEILVVKTKALGDVLRTTVILEGLFTKYKNPNITWITSNEAAPLLRNRYVEKTIIDKSSFAALKKKKWDLIISLEEDFSLVERVSKLKTEKFFGFFVKGKKLDYTKDSRLWNDMGLKSRLGKNTADRLKLLNKRTYPWLLYKMLGLKWQKQKYVLKATRKKSAFEQKPIGLVVGAGKRWPMKVIPEDRIVELIKKIQEKRKTPILLLAGPSYQKAVVRIKRKCRNVYAHKPKPLTGFIDIVNQCSQIIAPDTLSMHIGLALKKYVIAYFTITPAEEIEIYGGTKIKAKHKDYGSYSRKNKKRPNICDSIDLDKIVKALK